MAKVKIGDLLKGAGTSWLQIGKQLTADRGMTQDEAMLDKYGPNGEVLNISKNPSVARRAMPKRDVPAGVGMSTRHADGSEQIWRPTATTTPEQRSRGAELAKSVGSRARQWLATEPGKAAADTVAKAGGGEVGSTTAARGTGLGTVTPVSGYDDILKMMRHDALAEGDMARRQHNREVMTGLGDLVSSIANLWSTTKGGPNGYDNSKGMTATVQARYANDLARRRAQQEQILNYYRVKKAAEDDARVRKYREDQDAREQRRLDENERHNRELEEIAAGKAETDKENKERAAAEKERSNKAKETEQTRHNQVTENKKSQGRSGGNKSNSRRSRGSANNNTPPGRRQGNTNNNNVRPSQRK
jgi:hypothetical protein